MQPKYKELCIILSALLVIMCVLMQVHSSTSLPSVIGHQTTIDKPFAVSRLNALCPLNLTEERGVCELFEYQILHEIYVISFPGTNLKERIAEINTHDSQNWQTINLRAWDLTDYMQNRIGKFEFLNVIFSIGDGAYDLVYQVIDHDDALFMFFDLDRNIISLYHILDWSP